MKAIAKQNTSSNIKPMDGSPQLGVLTGGQYVYGDLSLTGTDIINFEHYYKADGTKVPLGKKCKVFIGNNLVVTNEVEPTPDPTPDPTPEPSGLVPLTVTIEGDGYKTVTVDLLPNDN